MKRKEIILTGLALTFLSCNVGQAVWGLLELNTARNSNATGTVAAGILASCDVEKIQLNATIESLIATQEFLETKVAVLDVPASIQEVTRVVTVKETSVVVEQKPCVPDTATPTPTKKFTLTARPFSSPTRTRTSTVATIVRSVTNTNRPNPTETPRPNPTDTPKPQDTQPPKTNVPNTNIPPTDQPTRRNTTAPQTAVNTKEVTP